MYLGSKPSALRFQVNAYGKPEIDAVNCKDAVHFNLSHSGTLALVAVTRSRDIGVDIEEVRPDLAGPSTARRYFSESEVAALSGLPARAQQAAFFRCWTRKEAFIKGKGIGLSMPLDRFDVSLLPDEPPALLASRVEPADVERWSLRDIPVGPHYMAAVAVTGGPFVLHCWTWQGS